MSLLERATGKVPPSLLSDSISGDGFEALVLKVLDANAFSLASSDSTIGGNFDALLQAVSNVDKVTAATEDVKKATLCQRRAVILTLVDNTPSASSSLKAILDGGYLTAVRSWLDDIVADRVGGIDLLLHLLSSIAGLPVDKTVVKSSGIGKAIGSLEKHKICAGSPNESAIKQRSQLIKDSWHSSVKAKKNLEAKAASSKDPPGSPRGEKRQSSDAAKKTSPESSKRAKTSTSLSDILKKTNGGSPPAKKPTLSISALAQKAKATANANSGAPKIPTPPETKGVANSKKKSAIRVKWSDHFGGEISKSVFIEGTESAVAVMAGAEAEKSASWNDRKKRDRLRERELLAKAKKSKLIDEDDDADFGLPKPMVPTIAWKVPELLPPIPGATPAETNSPETAVQNARMQSIPPVQYFGEADVPNSPNPLSGTEQAQDMTSQSSAVVSPIPFFAAAPPAQEMPASSIAPPPFQQPVVPVATGTVATPDYVQRLGLPPFLIGCDTRALDTLASSPGLLQTLIDANGMYDQKRLLDLVQTLTPQGGPSVPLQNPAVQPPAYQAPAYQAPAPPNAYGMAAPAYGQPPNMNVYSSAPAPGPSHRSSSEGNLHVSGYGPTTTQAEIIALFSPYVRVDEVVMKGNFSFVNTSDPDNANRAKEVLHGTLLGGMPIRINPAQRKNREQPSTYGSSSGAQFGASTSQYGGVNNGAPQGYGAQTVPSTYGGGAAGQFGAHQPAPPVQPQQGMMPGQGAPVNLDSVRDDRGNPATKNLFIAGYGHGTTEQQLRDLVGQYANVIGVVLKGTFSFVNTSDRAMSIRAREMLSNTMLNGGALRINFAKETGRLGTSFDVTYNQTSGPNAPPGAPPPGGPPPRGPPPPNQMNYYGRGY